MLDFLERGHKLIERGATLRPDSRPALHPAGAAREVHDPEFDKPEELDALESLVRGQLDALEKELQ